MEWLDLALAVAVGLLGANAFADAAGLPRPQPDSFFWPYLSRVAAGIVLFFLTLTLVRYVFRLGQEIVSSLSTVQSRPAMPITIALLVSGTLCVLAVPILSLLDRASSSPSVSSLTPPDPAGPNPPQAGGAAQVPGTLADGGSSIGVLLRPAVASVVLLIGSAILAVGVWSSLKPPPP
jgi:hypothetical protein